MDTYNKKVEILLSILEERYKSIHKIRERVQSMGIWSISISVVFGGWILESDLNLNLFQKILSIGGILLVFSSFISFYFKDLKKGFESQLRVAVRIEKALNLYKNKFFDELDESIYPPEWKNAGTEDGSGRFFLSTKIVLFFSIAFIILSILIKSSPENTYFEKYNKFCDRSYVSNEKIYSNHYKHRKFIHNGGCKF